MRAVAHEAGTTATAIYRHFHDKEALISALHKEFFQTFKGEIRETLASAESGPGLGALLGAYREFALDHPAAYEFLFILPHGIRSGGYPDTVRKEPSPTFRILADRVGDAMRAGALRQDNPIDVALTLDVHVLGLVMLYRSGRFGDDQDAFRSFFDSSLGRLLDSMR